MHYGRNVVWTTLKPLCFVAYAYKVYSACKVYSAVMITKGLAAIALAASPLSGPRSNARAIGVLLLNAN